MDMDLKNVDVNELGSRVKEKAQKVRTVSNKVTVRLSIAMVIINVIVLTIVSAVVTLSISSVKEDYILEVVDNIESTISTTMDSYFNLSETLSANNSIVTLLEQSSKANPMPQNANYSNVLAELSDIVSTYNGSIKNITILSVAEDSYIMSDGEVSTRSTVTDRSYYEAVTSRQTIITAPYIQSQDNTRVVSTSSPVFGSNGSVIGCVVVNVPTSFVSKLISDFGTSGGTWVIDGNNDVLAHSTASYIGENYSVVGVSGSDLTKELSNPTGALIHYTRNGDSRTGSVGYISNLGWRLIAGMDTTEFYEDTVNVVVILVVILALSVVLTLFVCARSIFNSLKPLKELNDSMSEMSKGNLSELPEFESDDEIGELCENLRTTMTNLDIYIKEISSNLNAFGRGDFTRQSELVFLGDFRAIQTSTQEFVDLITNTLYSLKSSVEQVTSSSDFVASGSQNLASGSIQQAESVNILNSNIEDVSKIVNENVKNVEYVNERSHQAATELALSSDKMNEMLGAMRDIQEASEAIQKIIKTIEDVAFQTNILALNAAVEAARAGSAGQGFAVVADEVRNLAARTSGAVKETVHLIQGSEVAVNKGSELLAETSTALNEAIEIVNGYMTTLDTVTDASKNQAVAIEDINSGINEITTVTQNNTAFSEESAATSEELSSQANVMKESIEQFKLN